MLDEFSIISIQQSSDCFRRGKFFDQFRRVCGPEAQSKLSVNTSDTNYSSINSFSPSEDDAEDLTSPCDDSNYVSTDPEKEKIV